MLTRNDALPLHGDVLVPVHARVLVMQSQRVDGLVAEVPHGAALGEVQRLGSSSTADKGRTATKKRQAGELFSPLTSGWCVKAMWFYFIHLGFEMS